MRDAAREEEQGEPEFLHVCCSARLQVPEGAAVVVAGAGSASSAWIFFSVVP